MQPYVMDYNGLGRVTVRFDSRTRRYHARWKNGAVHLTAPEGVSEHDILYALAQMAPQLKAKKPEPYGFRAGDRMAFDGFTLAVESLAESGKVGSSIDGNTLELYLSADVDPGHPDVQKLIARHIRRVALFIAPRILLPRARQISALLGVSPADWSVGRGSKRLGCCDSDRRISLSCMCIFLPQRLRDYIICHELAHLTHFDHSPQFHALCSRYCGGDGDLRRAELKRFKWPVPRC